MARPPSLDERRQGCVLWHPVVYRMTVRSNPRILIIYIFLPLVLAAGIAAPFVIGIFYGLIALAAALFFVWQLVKLTRRQLATRIETLTDEILFTVHGDEKIAFPWDQIRISGVALTADDTGTPRKKERRLFIYSEANDKMFAVTDEFANLDALADELRAKTDFHDIVLSPGETLKDRLREIVGHPPNGDNR
jgi:hypothetical protein